MSESLASAVSNAFTVPDSQRIGAGITTPVIAPSPRPGMGAAVAPSGGCTFRVWAPNARAVYVAGDFTSPQWNDGKIPLARDATAGPGSGHWSAFVAGVGAGAQYKFVIDTGAPDPLWKLDPYCRDATASDGNSVVHDDGYDWQAADFRMPDWNELVLYELHVGTFNDEPGGPVGTFADLMEELDYLRDLGVNGIEIMPATDYDTEHSMGYNPSLVFALEDGYGTPHAMKKLIDAAHGRGIAVVMDVVYNHFGPEGLDHCLRRFDGWYENGGDGIYFYNDERRETDFGPRPDFGRPEVRQFIRDNAMMWLHDYRVDGLRLDSTENIRTTPRGENPDGWALMQWIAREKEAGEGGQPWKLLIAEDLKDNEWITRPASAGGAGMNAQWDVGFYVALRDALVASDDAARDMESIRRAICHRYNGDAFQRVIYSESHDEVTVRHGKDLGRLPRKIDWHDAEGRHARKCSTLGAAVVLTAPGIPMLFMGQEFLEWRTWTDKTPLDWSKQTRFGGVLNLYRDLIRLRRNGQGNTRGLTGQHVNVFHVNHDAKVIAYHRWRDGGPGDDVVVVANFSHRAYDSYTIGLPRGGRWLLRFNSDWTGYAPDYGNHGYDTTADDPPSHGLPHGGNVGLGPYSAIVLSQ